MNPLPSHVAPRELAPALHFGRDALLAREALGHALREEEGRLPIVKTSAWFALTEHKLRQGMMYGETIRHERKEKGRKEVENENEKENVPWAP